MCIYINFRGLCNAIRALVRLTVSFHQKHPVVCKFDKFLNMYFIERQRQIWNHNFDCSLLYIMLHVYQS